MRFGNWELGFGVGKIWELGLEKFGIWEVGIIWELIFGIRDLIFEN